MRTLPRAIIQVLRQFELLFSERVWEWAKILLVGAILAPGKRTVTAVLSTDATHAPSQIVEWFVQRWQLEVTFEEARAHLGIETQRQWSDLAILRTTPVLLGLFSLVTLFAHQLLHGQELPVLHYRTENPCYRSLNPFHPGERFIRNEKDGKGDRDGHPFVEEVLQEA
ncbi:hypothetical protein K2Z83_03095 [Oscillochloris sp. ZM17-4]|nr:hypothetical protein [Oscillochloris sp. ZM17-4]MBX0326669.1 hypothetical protein [Oscillochloris sp. ZM17-4]